MRRYEISDQAWTRVCELLPGKITDVGTVKDNLQFLNAGLWIARSGAPWRDLPERCGSWNSVYRRFRRWVGKGVWQRVFQALQEPALDWFLLDSTTNSTQSVKKTTAAAECLDRNRGGFSIRIHVCCDALGNPHRFILSPEEQSYHKQAQALLAEDKPLAVIADKGYDRNCLAQFLMEREAQVVILFRANAKQPRLIDKNLYQDRNKTE